MVSVDRHSSAQFAEQNYASGARGSWRLLDLRACFNTPGGPLLILKQALARHGGRFVALLFLGWGVAEAAAFDLTRAVIVAPANLSRPEQKAITMLAEEVEKRTQIKWEMAPAWPGGGAAVIAVGQASALNSFAGQYAAELLADRGVSAAEGFRIRVKSGKATPAVFIVGNDARGVLFGVGYLLRHLRLARGNITLSDDFKATTAPRY